MDGQETLVDRRGFLKGAASVGVALTYGRSFAIAKGRNDDALLEDLSRRCFEYFPRAGSVWDWFTANPDPHKAMRLAGLQQRE